MTIVGHIVRWLKYSLAFYPKWLKSILAFTVFLFSNAYIRFAKQKAGRIAPTCSASVLSFCLLFSLHSNALFIIPVYQSRQRLEPRFHKKSVDCAYFALIAVLHHILIGVHFFRALEFRAAQLDQLTADGLRQVHCDADCNNGTNVLRAFRLVFHSLNRID